MVEIGQARAQQHLGFMQQFGFSEIHLNQIGLEFLGHFFQWRGDFRNRKDARHVRTAFQRVQRSLQSIGDWLRKTLGTIGEKADQSSQMRLGFVAKDLQQLGVQHVVVRFRRISRRHYSRHGEHIVRLGQRHGLSLGQGVRCGS